jgi:hypothetical protein
MPTQTEIEFFRKKFQGFSQHKLEWGLLISLTSGLALAPFDLLKSRAQLMQEGRVNHGFSAYRGVPMFRMALEIVDSGRGLRGLWTGLNTIVFKNLYFGAIRGYIWCLIYNKFNSDARSK